MSFDYDDSFSTNLNHLDSSADFRASRRQQTTSNGTNSQLSIQSSSISTSRVSALQASIDSDDDDYTIDDGDDDDVIILSSTRSKSLRRHRSRSGTTATIHEDPDVGSHDKLDKTRGILTILKTSKELIPFSKFERPTRKITFTIRYSALPGMSGAVPSVETTFVQHGERPMISLDPTAKEGDYLRLDPSVGLSTGSGALGSVLWQVDHEMIAAMRDELDAQAAMLRRGKSKRLKIDADRLLDPEVGIDTIVRKRFPLIKKFKHRPGSEADDLRLLVMAYREWSTLLHPNLNFRRIVAAIDKLSTDRMILNAINEMRDAQYDTLYSEELQKLEESTRRREIELEKEMEIRKLQRMEQAQEHASARLDGRANAQSATFDDETILQTQDFQTQQEIPITIEDETNNRRKYEDYQQFESLAQDYQQITSHLFPQQTQEEFTTVTEIDMFKSRLQLSEETQLEQIRKRLAETIANTKLSKEDEEAQRLFEQLAAQSDDDM